MILRWLVGSLAAIAVLIRLTYIPRKYGTDEAGYLTIAQQWHGHGTSLYTDLWVDRPPLLLVLFQIGDLFGGLTGVRILGAIIAGLIVIGTAIVTHQMAGRRAALFAAIVITAWTITPAFSSITVNGEYLAAPFVVWSMVAALAALCATPQKRALVFGFLAGVAGFAAMLVKQNHADGLLFGLLSCLLAKPLFGTAPARATKVFAAATVGGLTIIGATALLCLARGTSITGVYDAIYPFRFAADRVKRAGGLPPFTERFADFQHIWIASGVLMLTVLAILVAMVNKKQRTASLILVIMLAFVHVSVASGINFYAHYMVQLLIPVAVLAGVAATRSRWIIPTAVLLVVAAAVHAVPGSMFKTAPGTTSRVADALKDSGKSGDSITVLYGRAGVVFGSGMTSAYEHLFTLPLRVRDPKLIELNKVMSSDDPPTWVVKWGPLKRWGVPTKQLQATLDDRYTRVAVVCTKPVFLLKAVNRTPPVDTCKKS